MKNFFPTWIIALLILGSCNDDQEPASSVSNKERILDLAFDYYSLKDYKKAALYLDTLISMDSTNGEYYYKRAVCNQRLIKKQKAIDDYLKATQLKHRIEDAYFGIAINYAFDDDSTSLIYLNKVKAINPNFKNIDMEIEDCETRIREFSKYKPLMDSFKNRKK